MRQAEYQRTDSLIILASYIGAPSLLKMLNQGHYVTIADQPFYFSGVISDQLNSIVPNDALDVVCEQLNNPSLSIQGTSYPCALNRTLLFIKGEQSRN